MSWYEKNYKWLFIVPALILLASVVYLVGFYSANGDVILKDVSLTGGTSITLIGEKASVEFLESELISEFPDIGIREITDLRTGSRKGVLIETGADVDQIRGALESLLGYEINSANSSIEFTGASLSQGFYQQLQYAILGAFILMGWVVFVIFGESKSIKAITLMLSSAGIALTLPEIDAVVFIAGMFCFSGLIWGWIRVKKSDDYKKWLLPGFLTSLALIIFLPGQFVALLVGLALIVIYTIFSIPSIAVVLSAFSDIVMTLAVVDLLGIHLSSAGVIAFLMLIGYSVDTDILLTTRVLKRTEDPLQERLRSSLKTGLTMTLTSIVAIGVAFLVIYSLSDVLRQILGILLIGLGFDIINTWFANAGLLTWFVKNPPSERKGILGRVRELISSPRNEIVSGPKESSRHVKRRGDVE